MKSSEKKQFLLLQNIPLFIWSIKIFLQALQKNRGNIFLTYGHGECKRFENLLIKHLGQEDSQKITLIEGGVTRNDSVFNALHSINSLASPKDIILIHDSARPFVEQTDINQIIESLKTYKAVTLGYKVTDTIKSVQPLTLEVTQHLARETLRGILTPQGFHFPILWEAYENYLKTSHPVTDDTQLVEEIGYKVTVVEGSKKNIKITTPDDLAYAHYYSDILTEMNKTGNSL